MDYLRGDQSSFTVTHSFAGGEVGCCFHLLEEMNGVSQLPVPLRDDIQGETNESRVALDPTIGSQFRPGRLLAVGEGRLSLLECLLALKFLRPVLFQIPPNS